MDQNTEPITTPDATAPVADVNLTPDTGVAPASPDAGLTSNPSTTPDIVSFGAPAEPTITPVETPTEPAAVEAAPLDQPVTPAEPTAAVTPDTNPIPSETFVPTPEDGQPADAPTEDIPEPELTPAEAELSPVPPEATSVEPSVVSAGVPEEPVAAEPTVLATDPTANVPVAAEEQKPSFISRLLNLVGI